MEDDVPVRPKSGFSAFAALPVEDAGEPEPEEDEDFGGLMVRSLVMFIQLFYDKYSLVSHQS